MAAIAQDAGEATASVVEGRARAVMNPGDGKLPTPRVMYVLSFFGAIGGLLFGYDTGIVSGAMPKIAADLGFQDGDVEKEMIVSATCVFAIPGALLGGFFTTLVGRKPTIIASAAIFFTGAVIISASLQVWQLVLGRSILGLAIGSASQAVPMYIAEAAPPELRGQLTALFNFSCNFGQVVACIVAGLLQSVPNGWRYMMGLAAVPALLQFIGMLFLPESPRWLVERSRSADSVEVLTRLRGCKIAARVEVEQINEEFEAAAAEACNSGGSEGLAKQAFRRALLLGCGAQAIQQLCGINTVMYYSATIFTMAGMSESQAIWGSVLPAAGNCFMSFVALFLIERVGRRILMLVSLCLVTVGLISLSVSFHLGAPGPIVVAAMMLYILSFGIGVSPIPWTLNSEIYSLSYRALGTSLSTTTNWGVNFVVSMTFLSLCRLLSPTPTGPGEDLNPAGAFLLYAVLAVVGFAFVYVKQPETQGCSLEQIQALFKGHKSTAFLDAAATSPLLSIDDALTGA